MLVIILAIVQLVVIVAALYGFNQGWNIEEERPIGNGEDYGAGSDPAAPPRSPPDRPPLRCSLWPPEAIKNSGSVCNSCRRRDSNPQARKGNRF